MLDKGKNKELKRLLRGAIKSAMPINIIPMSFKIAQAAFDNEAWQFEIKLDGFRILSYCQHETAELRSRNNKSFDKRFAVIKQELQSQKHNAVFDGEVVIVDDKGCSDFSSLMEGQTDCLVYYVFDILWYDGYNLMDLPLEKRRKILKLVLPQSEIVKYSDHIDTNGKQFFELVKNHRIEGIVAKNKYSHYLPGIRTSQWLKIKTAQETQGVIAGILLDQDKAGSGFSSLIIGAEECNTYKYIGLVEAGLNKTTLKEILATGKATKQSIFSPTPNVNKQLPFRNKIKKPEVIWLEPTLKCNVRYLELDRFGMMRHASFKGLVG